MKFKVDENMPREVATILREFGHDADTVADEGLCGSADPLLLAKARQEGRFFITQDLDFSDIRKLKSKREPGVLVLRLNKAGKRELIRMVHHLIRTEPIETWYGCLVVVDEDTVRIRKLNPDD